MRPMRSLLIYILAVFGGGALLAPWLYWLTQAAAEWIPRLHSLSSQPFHRFVHRALMVVAVAGLWPLLREAGFKSIADVGLAPIRGQGPNVGRGFLLGFGSLALVAVVALLTGVRHVNDALTSAQLTSLLVNASCGGLATALIEEIVFRGALYGTLRKALRWPVALGWSSAIYAIVHFFQRVESPSPVEWTSGFEVLARMMSGFGSLDEIIPGFLNLTVVGVVLGLGYQRSGTLYFSIGLHAGWIFWSKSYSFLTSIAPGGDNAFWGSGKLIDGWFALLMIGLSLVVAWLAPFGPRIGAAEKPSNEHK